MHLIFLISKQSLQLHFIKNIDDNLKQSDNIRSSTKRGGETKKVMKWLFEHDKFS